MIDERFGESENIEVAIDFDDSYFYWIDNTGERKIIYAQIDKLYEIDKDIFLVSKNKEILAIP